MGIGREVSAYQEQTLAPILNSEVPLIIDADGLNILAEGRYWQTIKQRKSPTILTPHIGEFKRLFPQLNLSENSLEVLKMASKMTNTTILLKGAKTLVSEKGINNWIVNLGTPALARGGSGDVLSGFFRGSYRPNQFQHFSCFQGSCYLWLVTSARRNFSRSKSYGNGG